MKNKNLKSNTKFTTNSFHTLEDVYKEFFLNNSEENKKIVHINNLKIHFVDNQPCISHSDYKKIRRQLTPSRNSKEITVSATPKINNDELVSFTPCNPNEQHFLDTIYNQNTKIDALSKDYNNLLQTHYKLEEDYNSLLSDFIQSIKDKDVLIEENQTLLTNIHLTRNNL